jgi:hypothetical protein
VLYHLPDQVGKAGVGRPPQDCTCPGRVTYKQFHFRRPIKHGIRDNVFLIVEAHQIKRHLNKIEHGMALSRGHYVVIGLVLFVVDPIFWTQKRPLLRWRAALKIEESQCPKPARVTHPA